MRLRWGSRAVSRTRRTGLVTVAILAVTVASALGITRAYHLGVAATFVTVLVGGLVLGLPASMAGTPGDSSGTASPIVILVRDRRSAVVRGLVIGLIFGLLCGSPPSGSSTV
jgi:hypothetical protein